MAMNPDYAVGIDFRYVLQFIKVRYDEIGPALAIPNTDQSSQKYINQPVARILSPKMSTPPELLHRQGKEKRERKRNNRNL